MAAGSWPMQRPVSRRVRRASRARSGRAELARVTAELPRRARLRRAAGRARARLHPRARGPARRASRRRSDRVEPSRIGELAARRVEETRGARQRPHRRVARTTSPRSGRSLASIGDRRRPSSPRPTLARGSLVVHTDLGRVDARLAAAARAPCRGASRGPTIELARMPEAAEPGRPTAPPSRPTPRAATAPPGGAAWRAEPRPVPRDGRERLPHRRVLTARARRRGAADGAPQSRRRSLRGSVRSSSRTSSATTSPRASTRSTPRCRTSSRCRRSARSARWARSSACAASIPTRRALLDIGASGPLAGLAFAIPLYVMGRRAFARRPADRPRRLGRAGDSVLYRAPRSRVRACRRPTAWMSSSHPMAFGAWAGCSSR